MSVLSQSQVFPYLPNEVSKRREGAPAAQMYCTAMCYWTFFDAGSSYIAAESKKGYETSVYVQRDGSVIRRQFTVAVAAGSRIDRYAGDGGSAERRRPRGRRNAMEPPYHSIHHNGSEMEMWRKRAWQWRDHPSITLVFTGTMGRSVDALAQLHVPPRGKGRDYAG